jgi:hypothetical protein
MKKNKLFEENDRNKSLRPEILNRFISHVMTNRGKKLT